MPNQRAVNALNNAWSSQRDRLRVLLAKNGYDPATLDALPDPGDCGCELADAIRAWRDINNRLDAAHAATSGWRY